jgi:hypothetical protein
MHYKPKEHFTSFSILYFKDLLTDADPPTTEFAGSNYFIYGTVHINDYSVGTYVYIQGYS